MLYTENPPRLLTSTAEDSLLIHDKEHVDVYMYERSYNLVQSIHHTVAWTRFKTKYLLTCN